MSSLRILSFMWRGRVISVCCLGILTLSTVYLVCPVRFVINGGYGRWEDTHRSYLRYGQGPQIRPMHGNGHPKNKLQYLVGVDFVP
jgi:hypothetical protein